MALLSREIFIIHVQFPFYLISFTYITLHFNLRHR
jgi:hypothetical protein